MRGAVHKIILVEDSEDDALLFRLNVDRGNLRTSFELAHHFLHARPAIKYFSELSDAGGIWPDIVVLDIKLPGVNGFEVLKTIRQLNPAQVVAMFSSSDLPEDMATAEALRADLYQPKTYKPEEFSRFLLWLAELADSRKQK